MRTLGFLVAALMLSAGCATQASVPNQASEPKMMIAAAQERGAAKNPEAQLHLKLAKDRVNQAERLMADGEKDEAKLMLLRAEADAEYALALLRRDEARADAERVRGRIDELHDDMQTVTQ